MPEIIGASIAADIQKFSLDSIVELFTMDLTRYGEGILYFTPSIDANNVAEGGVLKHDGNSYTPIPIKATGFEWTSQGALPRPLLQLSNTAKILPGLLLSFYDLLGASVTRTRTLYKYMDGQPSADPTQTFPVDIYLIERKTKQNENLIEWELASAMDVEGRKIPGRRVFRDLCTHYYRVFDPDTMDYDYTEATCPYVGVDAFDQIGNPTTAALDVCGKRLSSCQLRFTGTTTIPAQLFPGVQVSNR